MALAMTARLLLGCALAGGLLAQDAHEIVRRSVELDQKYVHLVMQYTFIERQMQTQLAGDGKAKSRDVKTWDGTLPHRWVGKLESAEISPARQRRS